MKELVYVLMAIYLMNVSFGLSALLISIIIGLVLIFDYLLKLREVKSNADLEAFKLFMNKQKVK